MEITVKELAEELELTREAIHKQLQRHARELKGHVRKKGKIYVIDDVGQDFIRENSSRRNPSSQVVSQTVLHELEQLRKDNYDLLKENNKLMTALMAAQNEKIETETLLSNARETQLLLEQEQQEKKALEKEVVDLKQTIDDNFHLMKESYEKELEQLEDDLNRYEKTIFGLYRKK